MAAKQTEELEQILAENNKNVYKDETFDVIRYLLDKRHGEYSAGDDKDQLDPDIKGDKPKTKVNTMFCTNCGNEVQESAVACPKCGFSPRSEKKFCYNCGVGLNEKQLMCIKCGVNLHGTQKIEGDKTIGGLGVLCFLIPLLGLILYLVWKDEKPIKAKGAGKAALWGFGSLFVLYFISFCSIALMA